MLMAWEKLGSNRLSTGPNPKPGPLAVGLLQLGSGFSHFPEYKSKSELPGMVWFNPELTSPVQSTATHGTTSSEKKPKNWLSASYTLDHEGRPVTKQVGGAGTQSHHKHHSQCGTQSQRGHQNPELLLGEGRVKNPHCPHSLTFKTYT